MSFLFFYVSKNIEYFKPFVTTADCSLSIKSTGVPHATMVALHKMPRILYIKHAIGVILRRVFSLWKRNVTVFCFYHSFLTRFLDNKNHQKYSLNADDLSRVHIYIFLPRNRRKIRNFSWKRKVWKENRFQQQRYIFPAARNLIKNRRSHAQARPVLLDVRTNPSIIPSEHSILLFIYYSSIPILTTVSSDVYSNSSECSKYSLFFSSLEESFGSDRTERRASTLS